MRKQLHISQAIREGFDLTRGNIKAALVIMALFGGVEALFGGFDFVIGQAEFNLALTLAVPAIIIRWLVLAWLKAGWVTVGIRAAREGNLSLAGALSGLRFVLPYFVTRLVLTGFIAAILLPAMGIMGTVYAWIGPSTEEVRHVAGWDAVLAFVEKYGIFISLEILVLAIDLVPVVMVATYFGFALYILVDLRVSPIEAMRLSGKVTKGAMLPLVYFAFVAALVNLAGLLCLAVGLLITMPATSLAHFCIYRDLLRQTEFTLDDAIPADSNEVKRDNREAA